MKWNNTRIASHINYRHYCAFLRKSIHFEHEKQLEAIFELNKLREWCVISKYLMKFVSSWICRCVKVVADKLSICKIKIFGFYGFPKFVSASQWKTISYDDRMPPKTSFAFDCSKLNFSRFLFIAYSWCFFSNHVNNLKELHILKRATESIFYDESHIHLNVDFSYHSKTFLLFL